VAENNRIPFDLPEAESELVSGYFTEYAGMKFGMFYFAEYAEVVTSSMLIVTIFLGGWALPFLHRDGLTIGFGADIATHPEKALFYAPIAHVWMIVINVLAFFTKVLAVCFVQVFVRWTLPRFRYDQLMKLGWRVLLPASLANILVTGVGYLVLDKAGPSVSNGLQVAGDVTQAITAVILLLLPLRAIVGMFAVIKHKRTLVGSAAERSAERGGTKATPMQA
jgi:NADH-quinone oxidoreductase subunit H